MSLRMLLDGPDLRGIIKEVEANYGRNFRVVKAEQVRTGGFAGFFAKQHYEVTVEISDPKLVARITAQPKKEGMPLAELATRSQNDQAVASAQAWAKDLLQKARELNVGTVPPPAPVPAPVAAPVAAAAAPAPAHPRGVPLLDDEEVSAREADQERGKKKLGRLSGRKKAARTPSDRMMRATPEQQSRLRELLAQGVDVVEDAPASDGGAATAEATSAPRRKPARKQADAPTTPQASATQVDAPADVQIDVPAAAPTAPVAAAAAPAGVAASAPKAAPRPAKPAAAKKAPAKKPAVKAPAAKRATAKPAPQQADAPEPVPAVKPAASKKSAVKPAAAKKTAAKPAASKKAPSMEPLVESQPAAPVLSAPVPASHPTEEGFWRSQIADEIRRQRDRVENFYARRGGITDEELRNLGIFELAEAIARGHDVSAAIASAAISSASTSSTAVAPAPAVSMHQVVEPEPVIEYAPRYTPLHDGAMLVLVGDAHEAYQQACAIIKEYERPETLVFAVAPNNVTVPLLRAEEHFRPSDAHQLADLVDQLDVPVIVVVHAPLSILLNEGERVRVLQAVSSLRASDVWAVVDAAGRIEAIRRWTRCLEEISAVVITNEAECTDPRALDSLDFPVAFRESQRRGLPQPAEKELARPMRAGRLRA